MCSCVIALGGTARADDSIATFLQRRIPEELATEGVVLARANLAFEVEQVGDKLLVSLVDLSTGRVAASTKIDHIPADRDAAVASVTHVAAELAAQAIQRPIAPPAEAPIDPARRDIDEMSYRRDALWFPLVPGSTEGPRDGHSWRVFRGEGGDQVLPADFYKLVGRDDLAAAYRHRRVVMFSSLAASGLGFIVAGVLFAKAAEKTGDQQSYLTALVVVGGASVVGCGAAFWYATHLQPIPESEARSLADQYNEGLRRNLGLPVVQRPRLRDFQIAPFVTGHDGGLALGARF